MHHMLDCSFTRLSGGDRKILQVALGTKGRIMKYLSNQHIKGEAHLSAKIN